MTASAIERNLAALVAQNVSVVEADSNFSGFLTDEEFENEIRFMRRYTSAAHRLGSARRLVRLDVGGAQREIAARPANHIAGPSGLGAARPHRQAEYLRRPHARLAGLRTLGRSRHRKRLDVDPFALRRLISRAHQENRRNRHRRYLAGDVPCSVARAAWPDTSPGAAAKFKADTGMSVPTKVDWTDPVWRRWIAWRYREISGFLVRIVDTAKSVSKDISVVVETVTLDYGLATLVALDGSLLKKPAPAYRPGVGSRCRQRRDRDARSAARRLDQPHRHGEVRQGRIRAQAILDVRLWRSARRQPAGHGGGVGGRKRSAANRKCRR